MTVTIALDKQTFARPYFPVSSQGMMYFAVQMQEKFNDLFNGQLAFDRQLFSTPTVKTLSFNAMTAPTQLLHTVTAESGAFDDLVTIGAANNRALILRATIGSTITIYPGMGNIYSMSGLPIVIEGYRAVKLWGINGGWIVIGSGYPEITLYGQVDPSTNDDITQRHDRGSIWTNFYDKRTWICVDNTATNAVWKPIHDWKSGFSVRAAADAAVGVGCDATITGTGSTAAAVDDDDTWILLTTGTSIGNGRNIYTGTNSSGLVRVNFNPVIEWTIKTGPSIDDVMYWMGLGDPVGGPASYVDTLPAGNEFIGIRHSTTAFDSAFTAVVHNGTTQDDGGALSGLLLPDTEYRFRLRIESYNSRVFFSINGVFEQIVNSVFPANTVDLAFYTGIFTRVASAKSFLFSNMKVTY